MSHELFDLFGMLGFGVCLTTFFHRTLPPVLARIAGGVVGAPLPSPRGGPPDASIDASGTEQRSAAPRRPDSAI